MPGFLAKEFETESMRETGVVETYLADSATEAAQSLLYTKRLSNKNAVLGPTKRCVYVGSKCWAVVPEGKRR